MYTAHCEGLNMWQLFVAFEQYYTDSIAWQLVNFISVLRSSILSQKMHISMLFSMWYIFLYYWPGVGGASGEEEIQVAEEKFNESKLLAEAAMQNLLENDVRNVQHLLIFYSVLFLVNCCQVSIVILTWVQSFQARLSSLARETTVCISWALW